MFPNLDAEQARHRHTNADVAKILKISRQLYELKKTNGNFKLQEIMTLCELYDTRFEYLFASYQPLQHIG